MLEPLGVVDDLTSARAEARPLHLARPRPRAARNSTSRRCPRPTTTSSCCPGSDRARAGRPPDGARRRRPPQRHRRLGDAGRRRRAGRPGTPAANSDRRPLRRRRRTGCTAWCATRPASASTATATRARSCSPTCGCSGRSAGPRSRSSSPGRDGRRGAAAGRRLRVVATLDDAPEVPGIADIQALLDARGPTGGANRVEEVIWSSRFRMHHRVASAYRAGRLLLMGDAAHVHSPAGGQGMNTGLVDAVVLGGMLADVVCGQPPDAWLDRYGALRRPAAEQVLALAVTADRHGRDPLDAAADPAQRALSIAALPPAAARGDEPRARRRHLADDRSANADGRDRSGSAYRRRLQEPASPGPATGPGRRAGHLRRRRRRRQPLDQRPRRSGAGQRRRRRADASGARRCGTASRAHRRPQRSLVDLRGQQRQRRIDPGQRQRRGRREHEAGEEAPPEAVRARAASPSDPVRYPRSSGPASP